MRSSALVFLLAALLASCSGPSRESAPTQPSTFEVTGDEVARIAATGANQAGIGMTPEQWASFATRACRLGAWDHAVAAALGSDLRLEAQVPPGIPDVDLAAVAWFAAVEGCRELVPAAAIDLGPPLPEQ